jgi:hypothetical protein
MNGGKDDGISPDGIAGMNELGIGGNGKGKVGATVGTFDGDSGDDGRRPGTAGSGVTRGEGGTTRRVAFGSRTGAMFVVPESAPGC